ncbi:bifunctional 23S rRNA (guanine(2069)-N(7))-methyltransferase RlmK/23S rRNA (guanine(2445)-N(2))-methyltransferase RlmL [Psychrobacter sp. TAE2020]|uniref:bifunctional 23S rRNA (guanine(2069)-N(7))-methyltransferase RlmK/23S rRNA (guanine(2445)-N(2))-methyltransferase RlmL n=1 Tax=Psychrobacter sp. TAE2020 TaxID=2846762 RepID=UPI001C1229BB|nr:bifunctional 23S rRNA (guanine(2069)-N(7))-methyltransferase RlmK/23S rRNA (guanine(2445)-N(2))-methyltransferase RlmL [Psychrobacter sp. TAE2020]MBU5616332.1 bifunctional 23S rRNA (guanine(2069)-N(7))-methyltransferase RlmK/23S rRNA (guanine(2445)-N(2))-methyltransferase RlmL [Psychrobacter sp. TAE2020]
MTEPTTPAAAQAPLSTSLPVAAPDLALELIITCADGLEAPLQTELTSFGIASEIKSTGRLNVSGSLRDLYTICLWSRVASRVLMLIKRKNINAEYDVAEQLYGLAKSINWTEQFKLEQTFAIRLSVDKRVAVSQQFAMLRIKDAIADTFNEVYDSRPNVDSKNPDFAIFATVNDKQAELYLDLSGTSLHRRGYRVAMTDAPLKENLAAALLYSAGWHKQNETDNTPFYNALIDPMCGSGTFIIEALLMHCDYAVGIDKAANQFGFYQWQHHDETLWMAMVDEAQTRFRDALTIACEQPDTLPLILGFDADSGAILATEKNLIAAGLQDLLPLIDLETRALDQLNSTLSPMVKDGRLSNPLIITNPPYGERLGDEENIRPLYQAIGLILQDSFAGSDVNPMVGILASNVEQVDILPISEPKTLRCHNGAITVYFRYGKLIPGQVGNLMSRFEKREIDTEEGQDFINRLQKNLGRLRKQATKENVSNIRVYDADLPDFKVAIDLYGDYVHVQEYAPPKTIPPETARKRFNLALMGIREVLGINREQVFIKTRARQSGNDQYSKQGNTEKKGKFYIAREDDAYFYVNFTDYLDTGLFIDHRNMRARIKDNSRGKAVLNLFAYTCTASVHAALAGAKKVTSVDLSQNYLDWGKQNFVLNGLDVSRNKYQFVAADIFEWIKDNTEQFDIIFIDPPTFSNSKKFQGTFDVQRDHSALINRAMNRLTADGVLYFSNNFTRFELDEQLTERYDIVDVTQETIGFDFNVKKPIHQSFEIRHR